MGQASAVYVSVLGRDYKLKAPSGQEQNLTTMAAQLDSTLNELAKQHPQFARDHLLVLTALNLMYQQQQYEGERQEQQLKLAALQQQLQGCL